MSVPAPVLDLPRSVIRVPGLPLALAFVGLTLGAAALAGAVPIAFSIATVFLFAGPHNWLEARYVLGRLPARVGKLRWFFLLSAAGIVGLTAGYAALPWLVEAAPDATWAGPIYATWNTGLSASAPRRLSASASSVPALVPLLRNGSTATVKGSSARACDPLPASQACPSSIASRHAASSDRTMFLSRRGLRRAGGGVDGGGGAGGSSNPIGRSACRSGAASSSGAGCSGGGKTAM